MKKMTFNKIFGLSGLMLVASLAFAEGEQAGEFDVLDKNQDGVLSAAEASNSSELSTQWTNIDADGSGSIDRAEFSAFETEEIKDEQYDKSAPTPEKQEDMK
jgi:Ca2+-binding EF-hand superfamily protein